MKRWFIMAVVGCAALVLWLVAHLTPTTVERIGLAGFTNGLIGTMSPAVSARDTNHAAAIRAWLAEGTNGVVFTVTNLQSHGILIWPEGGFYTEERNSRRMITPLLNVQNYWGLPVQPGQIVRIQAAVLPHDARWKVELYYARNPNSDSELRRLARLLTSGRNRFPPLTGKMQSEWLEK